MSSFMRAALLRRIVFYICLLLLWEAVVRAGVWPDYVFPGPRQVAVALWNGLADGSFLRATLVSFRRLFIGYGISAVAGILLGLVIGRLKWLDETLGSLLIGIQSIPSICWLPLALVWFGLSEKAVAFVVVIGAFLAITIGTDSGVKSIPPTLLRAARNLGARRWRLLFSVMLPAALPSILTGLKQGWLFAWRSLMAGELLVGIGQTGLGHLLKLAEVQNDNAEIMAVMAVIVVVGLIVEVLVFARLEREVRERWGLTGV